MATSGLLYCAACGLPLRVRKNGVIIERRSVDDRPYQIFHGDYWECPDCADIAGGTKVLKTAPEPWTESFRPDYDELARTADYHVQG